KPHPSMTRPPLAALLLLLALAGSVQAQPNPDLSGLWAASLHFGPEISGTLVLHRVSTEWRAEIAGRSAPAHLDSSSVSFELPDGKGSFRGRRVAGKIVGHWIQPERYASPVTLRPDGSQRWRGSVVPASLGFTFYLPITRAADSSFRTFLRNPERNIG